MNRLSDFAFAHPVVGLIALAISGFTGYVAAGALYRAAQTLALAAANAIRDGAESAVEAISDGIVSVVSGCVTATARALGLLGWFIGRPFVHGWDVVRDVTFAVFEGVGTYVEQQRQMRELFRASPFRTWRDFLAHFNGEADEAETPEDDNASEDGSDVEFEEACGLFGLPLTGLFTQTALNAAFRKLMQKSHPDRSGDPGLAAKLNAARDLIREHKGWN